MWAQVAHFLYLEINNLSTKAEQLSEMLRPVVEGMGYVFWGIEYMPQGKHSVLRVYIDGEDGVNIDDCADVSRQLSGVLDVEDPISNNYTLEVSSPGMDRLLFTLEQFSSYLGHVIEVRLSVPFEGRRKFKGLLNGIEDGDIQLVIEDTEYLLPLEQIDKAQVIPQFED